MTRFRTMAVAFAAVAVVLGGSAGAYATPEVVKPELALKKAFPQLKFDSIAPTDIAGFYEVTAGENVFYYLQDKDYLFVGNIYNRQGKNLTAERRAEMSAKAVKSLPLDKAVRIGTGKTVVIEFTDPDCPFCRKVSKFLEGRTDVTRYIFFTPLAHPQAITKVEYILNAANKAKAYQDMMDGKNPTHQNGEYPRSVRELAQEHLSLARKVGIQGTPTLFINGQQVVGADIQKIERLLGKK